MSRKNNRARRQARRERKEGLAEAKRAFAEKYPTRGSSPTALMLNIIEQSQGKWKALERYRESVDPLSFDVFLMKKQAELRREFFRNNKWREGVESLGHEGWCSDREEG
jgi:hypothetical protein